MKWQDFGRRVQATIGRRSTMEGGCTCRQVRYRLTGTPLIVHACHCRWCQHETGAAHALNALYEADRVVHTAGRAGDHRYAVGKRKRPEDCALPHLQGRHLEQLSAGWTRRPLRAGRHNG
jgi:Glutathione-dependent formaldehyde-activating enzyme